MKQSLFVLPSKDSFKKFDVPKAAKKINDNIFILTIYLIESFNISLLLSFLSAGWLGRSFLRSANAPLTFCCLNLSLKLQFWQKIHQNMPINFLCTCDLRIFSLCIWMAEQAGPRPRYSDLCTPDLETSSIRYSGDSPETPGARSWQLLGSQCSRCMVWPRPRGLWSGHTQQSSSSPQCRHTRSQNRNLARV